MVLETANPVVVASRHCNPDCSKLFFVKECNLTLCKRPFNGFWNYFFLSIYRSIAHLKISTWMLVWPWSPLFLLY